MELQEIMGQARDAITVKRVFGDPIERDGTMIIPVARVMGGSGFGSGQANMPPGATGDEGADVVLIGHRAQSGGPLIADLGQKRLDDFEQDVLEGERPERLVKQPIGAGLVIDEQGLTQLLDQHGGRSPNGRLEAGWPFFLEAIAGNRDGAADGQTVASLLV